MRCGGVSSTRSRTGRGVQCDAERQAPHVARSQGRLWHGGSNLSRPPALGLAYEAWGNPEKAAEYRVLLEETDEVGVYQIGDV